MVRRPRRHTRRWPRRLLIGTTATIVVVALVAGAGVVWGLWSFSRIKRVDLDLAEAQSTEPQNYLLIGSDSREGVDPDQPGAGVMLGDGQPPGQRADSIAVVRVDPGSERIDMLSIPRDLWLPIQPGGEEQRINTAYAESTQSLIDTVEKGLGIPIHHYVSVNFQGFQDLIRTIGGVPLWFDHPVRDLNSGLMIPRKGCAVLDGFQGLAFARSRHLQWSNGVRWVSDPTGDLGRMTRQQLLARAAMAKVRSMGLDDVGKVKGLVDAGVDNVRLDDELGVSEMIGLTRRFSDFDPQRLQTRSLPVVPHRTSGGASVVLLDAATAEPVLQLFRGGAAPAVTTTTAPPPEPSDVTVDIFNGGGVEGEARRVSYVLAGGGFGIGAVETAEKDRAATVVRYAPGGRRSAELVAGWLGPAPQLKQDRSLEPGHVEVTLGQEFEHVDEPSTTTTAPPEPASDGAAGAGEGDDAGDGSGGGAGEGAGEAAAGGAETTAAPPTTTTTVPGWTPGTPPPGVRCG